jgi:hypothetical protein
MAINWEKSIKKQMKSILNELDEEERLQQQVNDSTDKLTRQASEKTFQRLMTEALQDNSIDCTSEIKEKPLKRDIEMGS